MTTDFSNLEEKIREAVRGFWTTRDAQAVRQGTASGVGDAGARSAVTGGAQMNSFVFLVRDFLHSNGIPQASIHCSERMEVPGWYRAEKKWDLLMVADGKLLAGIEFKSQVGPSFGNNFNNRTEEAIGSATDPLGGVPGRSFQAVGAALVGLSDGAGGKRRIDPVGPLLGTALPGVPG